MAQVKVTSYYTRRKRIDDEQPTKRRKLQVGSTDDEVSSGNVTIPKHEAGDMIKAALGKKHLLAVPRIDSSALLEDTVSKSPTTKPPPRTTRSTRKARSTQGRSNQSKKALSGPLDTHFLNLKASADGKISPPHASSDSSSDISESAFGLVLAPRSPPSTPTKRPLLSEEAPSRKKRNRVGSADVADETAESGAGKTGGGGGGGEAVRGGRRRLQAGRQPSRGVGGGRSAKKNLEPSLLVFAEEKSSHGEGVKEKPLQQRKPPSSPDVKPGTSSKVSAPKASGSFQEALDAGSVSPDRGKSTLQAFIERTTQSVASATVKAPAVNPALSDRSKNVVKGGQKAPSKPTPAEMRQRLSKACKLTDLQARLARVKECAEQVKGHRTPSPDAASTKEPTAAPTAAAVKEEPALPAYQKYHALIRPIPSTLALPFKYKLLEEMFRSTDTAVSMLHNRSEACTFAKVKQAVQEMCRKTFEQRNLGQIKTVFPTAYFLRQQKTARTKVEGNGPNSYELVLEANTSLGVGTSAGQESSEPSQQTSQGSGQNLAVSKLISKFTPSMLIARRSIFHNNLVDVVKEQHSEFLSKLDRPLSVPDDKLTRWHPKFPLDRVADIEPAPLPQPPVVTTYNTARDVLDRARVMMNPRVAKALEVVAKNSALIKADKEKADVEKKEAVKPKAQPASSSKSVNGVSQSLLDRIRAKEAQNVTAMMIRSPADQERIAMLERLPELCRILRVFFLSEKKAALPIEAVIQKLTDSYPSILSKGQVEKHVSLMTEVLPDWLSKVTVRKDRYLKLNKSRDMGQVTQRLQQLLRDSKQAKGQS